jgi:Na+/proline symporter
LLVLSALTFTGLYFFPHFSQNMISHWFESNIRSLEKAFFLGFIFQVLGFFFVLSVFFRLLKAFSPKPPQAGPTQGPETYTDYEEVSDQHLD